MTPPKRPLKWTPKTLTRVAPVGTRLNQPRTLHDAQASTVSQAIWLRPNPRKQRRGIRPWAGSVAHQLSTGTPLQREVQLLGRVVTRRARAEEQRFIRPQEAQAQRVMAQVFRLNGMRAIVQIPATMTGPCLWEVMAGDIILVSCVECPLIKCVPFKAPYCNPFPYYVCHVIPDGS